MKLCRWDLKGSSAGFWMVADHPGCLLVRMPAGWTLTLVESAPEAGAGWPERAWGEKWTLSPKIRAAAASLDRFYPTRAALIDAFGAAIAGEQPSVLSERIS